MSVLAIGTVALTGLCFGGLAYNIVSALMKSADSYAGTYSETASRQLAEMFLFIPPKKISEIAWTAAITATLLLFLLFGGFSGGLAMICIRALIAMLVGGIPMLMAPKHAIRMLKARRRAKFNLQLVDALANMGNALKSGFSITQAFEHVVANGENPISQEFDTMLRQLRIGVGFGEALRNLDERVGSDDLSLVVMAIDTARKTGGNLTEIFENICHTIRERIRIENRIRTLTAQGRMQGMVVGACPVIIAVVLYNIQPDLFRPFLHSVAGIVTFSIAGILLACGFLAIRKIVNIDV